MFGQDPQLPVDFLLGRIPEPVAGSVHDWIQEHQAQLQIAFEGVRERLRSAADQRKERHDLRVRDVPLVEGQLVYLRNYSLRGRQKIQDLWNPVVHQVLKAPKEGGAVYTVAPIGDLENVKHVHRTMLKRQIKRGVDVTPRASPPERPTLHQEEGTVPDDDLWVLVPETPQLVPMLPSTDLAVSALPVSQDHPTQSCEVPAACIPGIVDPVPAQLNPPPLLLDFQVESQSGTSEMALRRSTRPTAGQHSNIHHLPQAVGVARGAVDSWGPGSNTVSTF